MKHCPICNKTSDEIKFYGEFCADDAEKKFKESLPETAELTTCKSCGRIKVSGKFVDEDDTNVERFLRLEMKKYWVHLIHFGNGIARVRVVNEKQEGLAVETNIHIKRIKLLCERCARIRAGYYESVVQLRGEEGKVQRMAEAFEKYLEKYGAFVTKVEEKEHGVDMYTSNKKVTSAFISSRHLVFKASYELHGMKAGRKLYRNTYFITL